MWDLVRSYLYLNKSIKHVNRRSFHKVFFQKHIILLMWDKMPGQLYHPDIFVYPAQKKQMIKKHTLKLCSSIYINCCIFVCLFVGSLVGWFLRECYITPEGVWRMVTVDHWKFPLLGFAYDFLSGRRSSSHNLICWPQYNYLSIRELT